MGRHTASARLPAALTPDPGELGLLSCDPADLRRRTVRGWALFAELTESRTLDLLGHTRSRGHPARDLLVAVGAWEDSRGLDDLVADARAGMVDVESQANSDARLRAAHRSATDDEVRESVRRAAARVADWYDGAAAEDLSLITGSPLGPVPIGTYLHASVFHLAVTARDLIPAGATPSPDLDTLGVAALVDGAGAVAGRLGATASISALTPHMTAGTGASAGAWRTAVPLAAGDAGPAVVGPADLVVDVAAGRVDFLHVARSVRLRHPRRLVDMSVVLDGIPDLPAAAMLRRAAAVARRLPF